MEHLMDASTTAFSSRHDSSSGVAGQVDTSSYYTSRRTCHESTRSTVRSSTQHSWLRRFAVRRPLTAFLVLGISLGYTLALVWGLAYYGVIPGGGLADAHRAR
jgi:hypothetical protein